MLQLSRPTVTSIQQRVSSRAIAMNKKVTCHKHNGLIRATQGERGKPLQLNINCKIEGHSPLASDHALKGELLDM
jgi:hypothetical protein